jgi:excisionase family DNA binding protein
MPEQDVPKPLLTVRDVCNWIKKPPTTLYSMRHRGTGPRAIKVGNTLRFRREDVEAWLEAMADEGPGPDAA